MLKERLLSKDFYLDSMSMFLKNSFGMIDREETYRAILNNVNVIADSLISRYDLFNIFFKEDYFERNKPSGMTADEYADSTEDTVLDNIAAIFGLSRSMNVTYYGIGYANQYYGERGVLYTEPILLTNRELYIYIKIAITKLNFQGTAGEIKNLYYPTGEGDDDVKQLGIYYSWGGTSSSRLPDGYAELEYIESTGTQYIDSGLKGNLDTAFEIKAQCGSAILDRTGIFGNRTLATSDNVGLCYSEATGLFTDFGTNVTRLAIPFTTDVFITYNSKNYRKIGEETSTDQYTTTFETPGNMRIFDMYTASGTAFNKFVGKVFYCKIWSAGTLVRHMIPAQRNSDSAVGMYDLVNDVFYTNAGTGSFIAGTPVQPTTTGNPLVCNVWLCNTNEIARNNFNSNIVKLFLADELLVESLGIQYIKSLGMSTFAARFDTELPDLETYKYIFDPDFSNQMQETFKYAVFQ